MYADVIVDLASDALDHVFTYSVPEGLEIEVGQQVEVPFGPRRVDGFVVGLSDETALDPARVKPISRVRFPEDALPEEMISLADWMREKYNCNLVEALRLMLPSEMRGGRVREKRRRMAKLLLPDAPVRGERQREIVDALKSGDLETASLNPSALSALVKKGVVEIYEQEQRRAPAQLRGAPLPDPELTRRQARAVRELTGALESGGGRFLLHGVTGSGKTEVYIRLVRRALELKKTAIVLVPEIALTPQMVRWFHQRFGADAAVLHSGLSAGERFDEWRRIRSGAARVVVGARSAAFAPVKNLGAIVVDEEHEGSYQSDRRPRYDAREVAQRRAEAAGAVLVLGSATPSVASYMRAMPGVRPENRLTLIELPERVTGRPLPGIEVVDMRREFERGNRSILSARLSEELRLCIDAGRQAMLFINRRGHSSFVSCRKCGYVARCDQCDVSLTYHQHDGALKCHYCGRESPVPTACPKCGSRYIKFFGVGTEQVVEEVARQFPDAKCLRMDLDTTRGKDAHRKILDSFREGEADVLVGTQMIAKGLDFPEVTLVGVVAADMSLNLPDYRSVERTFQLITQMAGRAGRAEHAGKVILQTYEPDHYGIKLAASQDFRAFYLRESAYRKSALYPPFTVIARIVFSSPDEDAAKSASERAAVELAAFLEAGGHMPDVVKFRQRDCPVRRLRGEYRYQVFLKMYFKADVHAITARMQRLADAQSGARAELEVNPANSL